MRNGKLMTTRLAAIALSSMMVLSPLTAFASSGTTQQPSGRVLPKEMTEEQIKEWAASGGVFGEYRVDENGNWLDENNQITTDPSKALIAGSIQTGTIQYVDPQDPANTSQDIRTFFLDGDDNAQVEKENVDKEKYMDTVNAYFKKTITLRDYKNKTNFVPSVPDVIYTYKIMPVAGEYTTAQGYSTAMIFDGIEGGVYFKEDANGNKEYIDTLTFTHEDEPNGDIVKTGKGKDDEDPYTMTRLMGIKLDSSVFEGKDPGVYRYMVVENKNEKNIDGVGVGSPQDILDDITKLEDKYRARIIDVVVERVSSHFDDKTRRIAGVALRECEVELEWDGNGIATRWVELSKLGQVKVEGFTPYAFQGEDKTKRGPLDAHSRYYTFDLLVDKEVTGQGLTDKDVADTYSITVDLEGPAGAKVTVVVSNAETGAKVADDWTLDTDGKLTKTVGLKNNQSFEISGLPSGATYTIKEAKDSVLSKVLTNKELNYTEAGTITMDAEDEVVAKVDHDLAIKSSTKEVTNTKDGDGNVIVANEEKVQKLNWADENITGGLDVDVQNVLITNERLPITVTGVVMNVAPYALMVIAAAIFAGLFISKKRQEEEI